MAGAENNHSQWRNIYTISGIAALSAVLVGVLEIVITFLPGGNAPQETVLDWFMLFQENWFLGLRNLGLLNIIINLLAILTYFALSELNNLIMILAMFGGLLSMTWYILIARKLFQLRQISIPDPSK